MKKRVRLFSGFLALILSVSVLAGCGSGKDAEEIIDRAISEIKDIESMTTDMEMIVDMSVSSGETSISANMGMSLKVDQLIDEQISHGTGSTTVSTFGMSEEADIELYLVKEEGELVEYSKTDDGDWIIGDTGYASLTMINSKTFWQGFKSAKNLKHTGEGEVNKSKTEIVECKMDGDTIDDAMAFASTSDSTYASLFSGLSFKDTEVIIEAQFYQDSGLPASVKVDLTSVMDEVMKSEEFSSQMMGMDMAIDEFTMNFTFENYNEVDDIDIPDELADATVGYDEEDDYDYDDDYSYIEGVENPTGPWQSFEFTLNQKTYKLPVAYSEFTSAGWEIDSSSDSRIKVAAESTEYSIDIVNEKGDVISLTFYNDSKEEKAITDCIVIGVKVNNEYITDLDFSLPGGVKIGMSEDELNSIYKEYTDLYDSTYFKSYSYYGDNYYDMVYITLYDGKIDSLSIDHK